LVSSTWLDLQPQRQAVEQTPARMRSTRFVGMEYFGARDESTRDASLAEVDRSDIYLGVIGHRYGSGITEAEYRRAVERGLPCLIYLERARDEAPTEDADVGDRERLHALRALLKARHLVVEVRPRRGPRRRRGGRPAQAAVRPLRRRRPAGVAQRLRRARAALLRRYLAVGDCAAVSLVGPQPQLRRSDVGFRQSTDPLASLAGLQPRRRAQRGRLWSTPTSPRDIASPQGPGFASRTPG
jgi:hypothetical protein